MLQLAKHYVHGMFCLTEKVEIYFQLNILISYNLKFIKSGVGAEKLDHDYSLFFAFFSWWNRFQHTYIAVAKLPAERF